MSIKLQREHISLSEILLSRTAMTTAQGDIIVPDIKPDILKVLGVSADTFINRKEIQKDKVYIGGTVRLNILYIPDGDVLGKAKSVDTTLEFSHSIDAIGAEPGMKLLAEAECEKAEYTLINSRKINVLCKIGLNIKISAPVEMDIATDVDEESGVQIKGTHLRVSGSSCSAERDVLLKEELEISDGKPDIGEILRFRAKPSIVELKAADGRAVIKGDITFSTLYCGEDESGSIRFQEHTVPLSEVFDIDGLCEGMEIDAELCVRDAVCEIRTDNDGDRRIIGAEITLTLFLWGNETVEVDAICDAYGLKDELILEKKELCYEQLIDNLSDRLSLKGTVPILDYLPVIHQICDVDALPVIDDIAIDGENVTIRGGVSLSALYISDGDSPIASTSHVLPFEQSFNVKGMEQGSVCDAKAELQNISYTISGDREIEVRVNVDMSLKAVNPRKTQIIDEISVNGDSEQKNTFSAVIYFVQSGDTLWDIAKRYKTTPDAIVADNGAEKDILKPGSRIYIFR